MHAYRAHKRLSLVVLVVLALLLVACQEPGQPPIMTVVPITPQAVASPTSQQLLPQVVTGKENTSPIAPPTESALPVVTSESTLQPGITVWRPREIAARVQAALAVMLGAEPTDVPWLRFERAVDPAQFTCLDQLGSDIPTFGEGEALVYQYGDTLLYVVSSQGKVWVCRAE